MFCVPSEHVISAPPWVPENRPSTPRGFAFSGCERIDNVGLCETPQYLITGGVLPKSSFRGWRWQDFPDGAYYRDLINDPNVEVSYSSQGDLIVLTTPPSWKRWLVWKKVSPGFSPQLHPDDELLEVCQDSPGIVKVFGGYSGFFTCTRHIQGPDYSLMYSFYSSVPIPDDIEKLDRDLLSTIEAWRCDGN